MAATIEARRLTEAHRLAQARLGRRAAAQLLATWALLNPEALDATVKRWLSVAVPVISAHHRTSARLAANYLTTFRALELGLDSDRFAPVLAEDIDPTRVATSLVVTGPATVRRHLKNGTQVRRAAELAQVAAARAGMRHVHNGGRSTILATVDADRHALGWARATSGGACHFCAMLASRGPVYKGQETADFRAHDGCSCSTEPVYRRDAEWPTGAQQFRDQWQQAKAMDGDTAINFRRIHEGRAA